MFKKLLFTFIAAGLTFAAAAQKPAGKATSKAAPKPVVRKETLKDPRYKSALFDEVTEEHDVGYSDNMSVNNKYHIMDVYQPAGDVADKRPLIIWMHGGGFKFGSKSAKGIKLWCKFFAERGYVCAAINYTLSWKDPIFHFNDLKKSTYYAVQDARMAVRYFKQNAARYRIDPNLIILAGNSAGGMIALHTAYTNNAELSKRVDLKYKDADIGDDLGITDRTKIAAVINYWGGIFDLNFLKNGKIPIVDVFGSEDGIVPPDNKNVGLYGGRAIHHEADLLHIPNAMKVFDGYSHELQRHFNPIFEGGWDTEQRWTEAAQFTADFLYDKVIPKPVVKKVDPIAHLFDVK